MTYKTTITLHIDDEHPKFSSVIIPRADVFVFLFTNRWLFCQTYVCTWMYSHQEKIRGLKSLSSRFNSLMLSRLIVVLLLQVVEAYLNEHILFERVWLSLLLKSNYARKKKVVANDDDGDRYRCIDLRFFSFIQWHLTIWSNWVRRGSGKTFENNRKINRFFLLFDWSDVTVHNEKSHLSFSNE